jgi:hypothetical protein
MILFIDKNRQGGGMSLQGTFAASWLLASVPLLAIAEPAFDAAKAFGARPR